MISVLAPIGVFPFFVHAKLANAAETCGADLDFVFLTHQDVPDNLQAAFDHEEAIGGRFRVVRAPFSSGFDQLQLLDWAFVEADLAEWVSVQHCDLFWKLSSYGWLQEMRRAVKNKPDAFAFTYDPHASFQIGEEPVQFTISDALTLIRRKTFVEEGLSWAWGDVADLKLSEEAMSAIDRREVVHDMRRRGVRTLDSSVWLDGGMALTLEAALRLREKVFVMPWKSNFLHPWQFFRVASHIRKRNERTLGLCYPFLSGAYESVMAYSAVSSLFFERADAERYPLPWKRVRAYVESSKHDLTMTNELVELLSRYANAVDPVGPDDDMGYRRIVFKDVSFPKVSLL